MLLYIILIDRVVVGTVEASSVGHALTWAHFLGLTTDRTHERATAVEAN